MCTFLFRFYVWKLSPVPASCGTIGWHKSAVQSGTVEAKLWSNICAGASVNTTRQVREGKSVPDGQLDRAHDVQPECVTGGTTCNPGSPSPKRSAVQVRFFAQELEEYYCKYQNGNQCYTSLLEANSLAQDFVTTFKGIVRNLLA